MKWLVKFINHLIPNQVTFGNIIKFFFNKGCEVEIHNLLEIFHQEVIDNHANIGWEKFRFFCTGYFTIRFF